MRVGVPREIKNQEGRVALTPAGAAALAGQGHSVRIEAGAGRAAGLADDAYQAAGATIVASAAEAWDAELVVKVKEPLPAEYDLLAGQILFTFLHLAGVDPELTRRLLAAGTVAVAYETVRDASGRLPLLAPMSAIAGNMAAAVGCYYLGRPQGGKGVQLGQVLGRRHGRVLVIGDGVVGRHAARTAYGLGANVTVAGQKPERAAGLRQEIGAGMSFVLSEPETLAREVAVADLVVGAVLVPGALAPELVSEAMVASMEPGSVIVDVAIDQGGSVATSRPTSHSQPIYQVQGVIHYCVTNMPGAFPRTATLALTDATLPCVLRLAAQGRDALRAPDLAAGVNTFQGRLTCRAVAEGLDMLAAYQPFPSHG
ncbi:MAG: alanine dehydrogenase [Thermodesulfobacteriota bacterium]